MNYYISDTHFCHKNIMRYDSRPWNDVVEMELDMIDWWNAKVSDNDDIYIIGDFCWGDANDWKRILPKLKGRKHLILGNHDAKALREDVSSLFAEKPTHYKEIKDGEYKIVMSHYPMISYHNDTDANTLMFYGHVHGTLEFDAVMESVKTMKECCRAVALDYRGRLYNCWCGLYGWTPATLMEILTNKYSHGSKKI
ncbi:MAG: metallophosphoesterase family protein [Clostridiales bacterium]|nr:metallophosphoesterase family protein [Clostridiales bacterium]MBP3809853.1 metallophosphoesterase family protein [Clostridiales bacterium]